jgi:hypothetical protein
MVQIISTLEYVVLSPYYYLLFSHSVAVCCGQPRTLQPTANPIVYGKILVQRPKLYCDTINICPVQF